MIGMTGSDIDQAIQGMFLSDEEEMLDDEKARRQADGKHYRYRCTQCAFEAEFFHEVTIHMIKSKACSEGVRCSGWAYPILVHSSHGDIP